MALTQAKWDQREIIGLALFILYDENVHHQTGQDLEGPSDAVLTNCVIAGIIIQIKTIAVQLVQLRSTWTQYHLEILQRLQHDTRSPLRLRTKVRVPCAMPGLARE